MVLGKVMEGRVAHDWEACPPGQFAQLAARLRARRRRRRLLGATAAMSVAVALAGMWSLRARRPRASNFAGITCVQVQTLAPAFAAGTLNDLLRRQVRAHLAQCRLCRTRFQAMGIIARQHRPRGPGPARLRAEGFLVPAVAQEVRGPRPSARAGPAFIDRLGSLDPFARGAAVETASSSVVFLDDPCFYH